MPVRLEEETLRPLRSQDYMVRGVMELDHILTGTAQQPGPQNPTTARLCRQSEPAMAGRKGLRMAEANRPAAPGQVARSGKSGLAVRL